MLGSVIRWDSKSGGFLGISAYVILIAFLFMPPPYILQCAWRSGYLEVGVAGTVIVALLSSVASSALWLSYIRQSDAGWIRFLGIGFAIVLIVSIDSIKDVLAKFPDSHADERLMRGALIFWLAMIAYAAKAPWDDLRDVCSSFLRAHVDKARAIA